MTGAKDEIDSLGMGEALFAEFSDGCLEETVGFAVHLEVQGRLAGIGLWPLDPEAIGRNCEGTEDAFTGRELRGEMVCGGEICVRLLLMAVCASRIPNVSGTLAAADHIRFRPNLSARKGPGEAKQNSKKVRYACPERHSGRTKHSAGDDYLGEPAGGAAAAVSGFISR